MRQRAGQRGVSPPNYLTPALPLYASIDTEQLRHHKDARSSPAKVAMRSQEPQAGLEAQMRLENIQTHK